MTAQLHVVNNTGAEIPFQIASLASSWAYAGAYFKNSLWMLLNEIFSEFIELHTSRLDKQSVLRVKDNCLQSRSQWQFALPDG